jgi:hypothetical protein
MPNTDNNTKAKKIIANALKSFGLKPKTLIHTNQYQHLLWAVEELLNSGKREQALTWAWEYAKDLSYSKTFVPPLDSDDSEYPWGV